MVRVWMGTVVGTGSRLDLGTTTVKVLVTESMESETAQTTWLVEPMRGSDGVHVTRPAGEMARLVGPEMREKVRDCCGRSGSAAASWRDQGTPLVRVWMGTVVGTGSRLDLGTTTVKVLVTESMESETAQTTWLVEPVRGSDGVHVTRPAGEMARLAGPEIREKVRGCCGRWDRQRRVGRTRGHRS